MTAGACSSIRPCPSSTSPRSPQTLTARDCGRSSEFRRRLDADTRYLDLLAAGEPFSDPRCTLQWLRDWHEHQLRSVAGLGGDIPG
jgi:hypothetical protein